MINPWRGEVALVLNGQRHVLRLTLGALAALEAELDLETLPALVARFEAGDCSAADIALLLLAGLRGGGWQGDLDVLAMAEIEGGAREAARVAALLLARAFGTEALYDGA